MSFLKKHWKPFCLGAWALGCGSIVVAQWCEPEPAAFAQLKPDVERIKIGLNAPVSIHYPYAQSPEVRLCLGRARPPLETPQAPPNIVYPRLPRPAIDPATRPNPADVTLLQAELHAPSNLRSSADHGRVCLEFQAPPALYMNGVRAEIFRGSSANSMDLDHPYGSIYIPPGTAADAWLKFTDTRIEPKKTYYYRIRLAGAGPAETSRVEKDAAGKIVREMRWLPPLGASIRGAAEYASAFSAPQSVESPSNFEVRFSGAAGSVPLAGQPPETNSDYTGRFTVRIWIPEAQDWKETTLELHAGERLAGKVLFVPRSGKDEKGQKDSKAFNFDTRLVLEEITRVLERKTASVREQVLNPDGSPALDAAGQPKVETRTVTTTGIPRDRAIFRDLDSGKTQELTK